MVVVGLIDAGVIPTLNKQVRTDADALTRERASKALSIAASDANGRRALLDAKTPSQILRALDDAETKVRKNAYEALIRVSSATLPAVHALIDAKYPSVLVGKAASENVTLQPLALRLLVQCLRDEVGLEEALANSAVETSITLLASFDTSVRREAANALGMLCFAEMAKVTAIQGNAVPQLVDLMRDREVGVRIAAVSALMTITTTDNGKKAIVPNDEITDDEKDGVPLLMQLLKEDDTQLKLNVLKCMANVAVHPVARERFKTNKANLALINELCSSDFKLLAKHAEITKKAVLWK